MLNTKDLHLCLPVLRQRVERQAAVWRPRDGGLVNVQSAMARFPGKMSQLSHQRETISHSPRLSSPVICASALNSKCSTGQTQTVDRQSSNSTISPLGPGMQKTPKLEKGGDGGPPHDGGGGGGGGGGDYGSGGFFLFAFLLFLRYLKDREKEKDKEKEIAMEAI